MAGPLTDARFLAAIEAVRRTGAASITVRYSDDQEPTVWIVAVRYDARNPAATPELLARGGWADAGAALTPTLAATRLAEQLYDGGECVHCHRPTMFDADARNPGGINALVDLAGVCAYRYDPETRSYRRSCEGMTIGGGGGGTAT